MRGSCAGSARGADANSGGEIDVALRAGFIPAQIVFTGVGKTAAELAQAIDLGVRTINAESAGELERIDGWPRERQTRARVALRVNPDIDARSHPHISTGLKTNKFGIADGRGPRDLSPSRRAARARDRRRSTPTSARRSPTSSRCAAPPRRWSTLARELRGDGMPIEHLDLGGGLGVSYDGSRGADRAGLRGGAAPDRRASPASRSSSSPADRRPGRRAADPRGRREGSAGRQGCSSILDAGMTELIRPMLYGAFHRIEPVVPTTGAEIVCDIVGPLCESSDTLGQGSPLAAAVGRAICSPSSTPAPTER